MTVYAQNSWVPPWQQNEQLPWENYGGGYSSPQQNNYGQNIGDMLKYLAGARYNFQGMNIKPQQNIAAQMANLAGAQVDESSPTFQNIYGQEKQAAQQNLAESIAEAGRQNRKLSMLGRTPLFDPERGGETQFRAMTQGYQTAQDQARQRARQIIGAGQNALSGAFNAANTVGGLQQQNRASKTRGIGNIADALPLLFKFFG